MYKKTIRRSENQDYETKDLIMINEILWLSSQNITNAVAVVCRVESSFKMAAIALPVLEHCLEPFFSLYEGVDDVKKIVQALQPLRQSPETFPKCVI